MKLGHNLRFLLDRRRKLRKTQTEAELKMWRILRRRNVLGFKFARQYSIGRFILDFYCHDTKLGIEIDGPIHEQSDHREHDAEREQWLIANGVRMLRFTNDDVFRRTGNVMRSIKSALQNSVPPL